VAVALHGGLLLFAAVAAWRRRDARALGLLAGLATGAGLLVAASQVTPVLLVRTALFTLAFALPLYGWSLARMRPRWLGLAVAAAVLVLQVRSVSNHYAIDALGGRNGESWEPALRVVEAAMAPAERLVLVGSFEAIMATHHAGERVRSSGPFLVVPPDDSPRVNVEVTRRLQGVEIVDPDALARAEGPAGFWIVSQALNSRGKTESLVGKLQGRGWSVRDSGVRGNIRVDHLTR
jgi:hypothetical protein